MEAIIVCGLSVCRCTSARLDEDKVGVVHGGQLLAGLQVGADVLSDGGVRAASCLDGTDAVGRQRRVLHQELAVLLREDVVRHLHTPRTALQVSQLAHKWPCRTSFSCCWTNHACKNKLSLVLGVLTATTL
jgi:hypothetical protein